MVPGHHKLYINGPQKVCSVPTKCTLCSKRVACLNKVCTISKSSSPQKVYTVPTKRAWSPQSVLGPKQVCPLLTKPSWHVVLRAHKAKSLLSGLTGHAYCLTHNALRPSQRLLCSTFNPLKSFHLLHAVKCCWESFGLHSHSAH